MQAGDNRGEPQTRGGSLESEWVPENEVIPFFRWSARVLGVILAGFSLLMFIGETYAARRTSSPPIDPKTLVGLILAGGYVIGMFLALAWERAGAIVGGTSLGLIVIWFFVSGVRSHGDPALAALWCSILGFAYLLPVALYVSCWWLEERDRKRWKGGIF